MIWYAPVIGRLVTAYVLAPFIQKRIAGLKSRPKRLSIMFFFCAVMGVIVSVIFHAPINLTLGLIMVVGVINAFGTYCQWRAIDINLSLNSLFTVWDDIIAMSLSYFFLREGRFMNLQLGIGISLSLLAVVLFVLNDFQTRNDKNNRVKINPAFYGYVLCYSVIWGLANFLMNYWAVKTIPTSSFVLGWYSGAFVGSLIIFRFIKEAKGKIDTSPQLNKKDVFTVFVLGFLVFISMVFGYWSLELAPQIVVQPIFLVGELTLPAIIGLLVFKERKGYAIRNWVFLGIGVLGGYLVGTSI